MKRSGFARPAREATQCTYTPRPRAPAIPISDGKARLVVPVPKRQYVRDKDYRRWVASLNCAHCGVQGYSQAAHADSATEGKGLGIKATDSACYPACGPRPGIPGCHWLIGTSGQIPKEQRRELEAKYVADTNTLRASQYAKREPNR